MTNLPAMSGESSSLLSRVEVSINQISGDQLGTHAESLRLAVGAINPADLTVADRLAILDLLGRCADLDKRRSAISDQRSAISDQRSAISGPAGQRASGPF